MNTNKCVDCEHDFKEEDTCPIIRYIDLTFGWICRKCYKKWASKFVQPYEFWQRREAFKQVPL